MNSEYNVEIAIATPDMYAEIGQLMVNVYANLDGFPAQEEQPNYYEMLANIGDFANKESVDLLVAQSEDKIFGAVVYIGDMKDYGSGGTATRVKDAAGFRLLAVSKEARGLGLGRKLTIACIEKAKMQGLQEMIIHTTEAMRVAWGMYEKMGFERSEDLDFLQRGFPVFGFRLKL
ncbi:GNAT family N-acetyltransferase [Ekhidna sp.]|uniref:GNAT family N-acetyltransferase n=1 Tax=Ekhidna sp. TaxID=2608089 RepID=UPI0032991FF1